MHNAAFSLTLFRKDESGRTIETDAPVVTRDFVRNSKVYTLGIHDALLAVGLKKGTDYRLNVRLDREV